MPLPDPDRLPTQRVFDNPDGFAMAFSEAWEDYERQHPAHGMASEATLTLVLVRMAD